MPALVPPLLRGAWRRESIENADGSTDTTSTVLWLQLDSVMADVRLAADLSALTARGSLDRCSIDELLLLSQSESSTGHTTCTPISVDADGTRCATAEWHTRQPGDVAFQPVTAYPEPGLLEWNEAGDVMIERAPSGAYVEVWHRVSALDADSSYLKQFDGRTIYRVGDIAVAVRDRPQPVPRTERLETLMREAGDDASALAALVDCEFSIAQRDTVDAPFAITASTLPWLEGELLDVNPR